MLNKYFKFPTSILCCALGVAFSLPVAPAQSNKSPRTPIRDLSLYEQSKTYDFNWGKTQSLRAERDEFREYVWQQWVKQRRTKVVATFYTREGDPTTSTYYLEPDDGGRWHIVVESVSDCCWSYAMQTPKKKREQRRFLETYTGLERVKMLQNKKGLFLRWVEVSTNEQLPPQSYVLRLVSGEEKSPNVF